MARTFTASQAAIALAAAGTAKTLIEIGTPSDTDARLIEWGISFQDGSSADKEIKVELMRASGGITGTTITPPPENDQNAAATSCTAKHTASAEGTATDMLEQKMMNPVGLYEKQYPLGREPHIKNSSFMRIRVTIKSGASTSATATVYMKWEE